MSPGHHGSTFGGNPIACAVGEKVIDIISKKTFLKKVTVKENIFIKALEEIQEDLKLFEDIKSAGLWISVTFKEKSSVEIDDLIKACHNNGLMILKANINTIRFSPSLLIEKETIIKSMEIFKKTLLQNL